MGEPLLIVDDSPVNAMLLSFVLTKRGYEVRVASDAEQAIAMLEGGFRPRVIFMDVQLPGMDGLELTRRLKADPRTKDIIVLAVTAFAMKQDEERALAAGCDGYVSKPIDVRALPGMVERILKGEKLA